MQYSLYKCHTCEILILFTFHIIYLTSVSVLTVRILRQNGLHLYLEPSMVLNEIYNSCTLHECINDLWSRLSRCPACSRSGSTMHYPCFLACPRQRCSDHTWISDILWWQFHTKTCKSYPLTYNMI